MADVMEPIVRELARIADMAESFKPGDDHSVADMQCELAALRAEVAGLRRAVAHLRSSNAPVPVDLRPVVARAVLAGNVSPGRFRSSAKSGR
ncbi:hypothetical protein GCM10009609_74840 [Pseudonocardia aurantiaca]|uniref:Uncharacterized protein n=1 Tax=Pseudonocardia aurantiaca TaxID=75290 RepID=A0ABW4FCU1_9PSEU